MVDNTSLAPSEMYWMMTGRVFTLTSKSLVCSAVTAALWSTGISVGYSYQLSEDQLSAGGLPAEGALSGKQSSDAIARAGAVAVFTAPAYPTATSFGSATFLAAGPGATTLAAGRYDQSLSISLTDPQSSTPSATATTDQTDVTPAIDLPTRFRVVAEDRAAITSQSGQLLASIVFSHPDGSATIVVDTAQSVNAISIDGVIVIKGAKSGASNVSLTAPYAWDLAIASQAGIVPGRPHHLQIVVDRNGVTASIDGKVVAQTPAPEKHNAAQDDGTSSLLALKFSGFSGELAGLSVTRQQQLNDGRMRATLLGTENASLASIAASLQPLTTQDSDDRTTDAPESDATPAANISATQPAPASSTTDGDSQQLAQSDSATSSATAQDKPKTPDTAPAASAPLTNPAIDVATDSEKPTPAADPLEVAEAADPAIMQREIVTADHIAPVPTLPVTRPAPTAPAPDITPTTPAGDLATAAVRPLDQPPVINNGADDDFIDFIPAPPLGSADPDAPSLGILEMAGLDDSSLDASRTPVAEGSATPPETDIDTDGSDPLLADNSGAQYPLDRVANVDDEVSAGTSDQNADRGEDNDLGLSPEERAVLPAPVFAPGLDDSGAYARDDTDSYTPEEIQQGYTDSLDESADQSQDPLLMEIANRQEMEQAQKDANNFSNPDDVDDPQDPIVQPYVDVQSDLGTTPGIDTPPVFDDSTALAATDPEGEADGRNLPSGNGNNIPTGPIIGVPPARTAEDPSLPAPTVQSFLNFDPATSTDVIAWYRMDGSLSDERGTLRDLTATGARFDSDSFFVPRDPGNEQMRVTGTGDQLISSVDSQLLNFVGVTRRISISALLYVNEWQSDAFSSPTILQLGGNSGAGISLVDSSQGRFIRGLTGTVIGSAGIDAALTLEEWHHVRLDLTRDAYEVFIDGQFVAQAPAENDLDAWTGLGNATIRLGNFDGWVDELIVLSDNDAQSTSTPPVVDPVDPTPTDPEPEEPDDGTVALAAFPLRDSFMDVTGNSPELEVAGDVQFSLAPPTSTGLPPVSSVEFGGQGDELVSIIPLDRLIDDPLVVMVFEADIRVSEWRATTDVSMVQLHSDDSTWFSLFWDPDQGPVMAVAGQELLRGQDLSELLVDNEWHRLSFVMTPGECLAGIDDAVIGSFRCPRQIENWANNDAELTLGNFRGWLSNIRIRVAEESEQ